MTQSAKEIIKKISGIQMDAIKYLMENPEKLDYVELREFLQIDNEEYISTAKKIFQFYQNVSKFPANIQLANEYQLLICSHILFKMEDIWILDNPEGVRETWSIIHNTISKYHSEFKIFTSWYQKE